LSVFERGRLRQKKTQHILESLFYYFMKYYSTRNHNNKKSWDFIIYKFYF